jgi:hypothetical protein
MDSVKIGPFTFNVYFNPKVTNDKGEEVDGKLQHGQNYIAIDDRLSVDARLQTLLHEVVHEKLEIQCGQDLGENAEGVVDAIAFMWIEVMRDNPELVRMITKG